MKNQARWCKPSISTTATTLTKSTRCWKNIRPGAFEPVHDLLEGFEGNALLAILQAKEARGRYSELPGERSIRHFTPPFTEEDRKLMVQRLPHGETVNKSLFLLRNIMLVLGRKGNKVGRSSRTDGE